VMREEDRLRLGVVSSARDPGLIKFIRVMSQHRRSRRQDLCSALEPFVKRVQL
jgi:hypothetical protein